MQLEKNTFGAAGRAGVREAEIVRPPFALVLRHALSLLAVLSVDALCSLSACLSATIADTSACNVTKEKFVHLVQSA